MILVALLLIPFLAAGACFVIRDRSARGFAALTALVEFALVLWLMDHQPVRFEAPWMPGLGLGFELQADGLSLLLLLLAPLLTTLALVLTPSDFPRLAEYCSLVLLLLGALQGLFLADNLGLFYIFFEVMLLPTLLLASFWGGEEGRSAALKFFLFTLAGSLPMLLAILFLAFFSVTPNLSFGALGWVDPAQQVPLLILFSMAFAVKIPLFPLHGWLPGLYRSLPAPVTAVVAGVMSKAGIYGFLKVGLGLFPAGMQELAPYLAAAAVFSLLYGALCALGADTLRGVLAYSSLSHLGMIALGVFALNPAGVSGAVLQMLNHGIATGGLFLTVALLESRRLPGELDKLGGAGRAMPRLAVMFTFLAMASLGLPGLCSFPGEVLILTGLYEDSPQLAALATLAIVLAAWYTLRMFQAAMHGPVKTHGKLEDLGATEFNGLLPLVLLAVAIGVAPGVWVEPVLVWLETAGMVL